MRYSDLDLRHVVSFYVLKMKFSVYSRLVPCDYAGSSIMR
jgi:hypothetical protein